MKKTPDQMASLVNSPKQEKKGLISITQTFQENGRERNTFNFYDTREENKTNINMQT